MANLRGTKWVTIDGVKYPIFMSVNATAIYCDLRGVSLADYYNDLIAMLTGKSSPSVIRDIIYSCIKEGCRREGQEFDKDNYFVGDYMDDMSADDVKLILDAIAESLPKNEVVEEDKKDKKKV